MYNDLNGKIAAFLEKWNEMMDVATDINEFKWDISVSITSDNSLRLERTGVINGINESFARCGMNYECGDS